MTDDDNTEWGEYDDSKDWDELENPSNGYEIEDENKREKERADAENERINEKKREKKRKKDEHERNVEKDEHERSIENERNLEKDVTHKEIEIEKLPALIEQWADDFNLVSKENRYASILAYFNILGQALKDDVTIPFGNTVEDSRVHVCWIQTARTGKSVLNDFYAEICNKLFSYMNATYNLNYTIFDTLDITDSAMVGNHVMVDNPLYDRHDENNDELQQVSQQIDGALVGSGLILFDEFESSGIFSQRAHKENVVVYFQKLMNTLSTDGYIIKKRLAGSDEIICDCQRSVWGTSYVPEKLTYVIAQKGVLQRMFMFVREVPKHIKDKMIVELIETLGTREVRKKPIKRYAQALMELVKMVKEANATLAPNEELITFDSNIIDTIKMEYKGMVNEIHDLPPKIQATVSLFETNYLIYIVKMSVLCAITESYGRETDEKFVVFPRNVRQASVIVRQGYTSLASWLQSAIRVKTLTLAEDKAAIKYISAYEAISKDEEGWALKTELKKKLQDEYSVGKNAFYGQYPKIKHIFEEKKKGKTIYLKLKEEDK